MSHGSAAGVGTGKWSWSSGLFGSSRTMSLPLSSVNQTLPSEPVVIQVGRFPPAGYSKTVPFGRMTPTLLMFSSVNHSVPSGIAVIPHGCDCELRT